MPEQRRSSRSTRVEQRERGALVGRSQDLPGRRRVAEPRDRAGRLRAVRCPLAVEERQDDHLAAILDGVAVEPEPACDAVDRERAVQRAREREVTARRVGEPGDDAGRVGRRGRRDDERRPRGAEAHDRYARVDAETQGGGHVVSRAAGDERAGGDADRGRRLGRDLSRQLHRAEDGRKLRAVEIDQIEHAVVVRLEEGRPPAGSRGVAAVGDRTARESLGHVVVRQAHARDLRCQVRLLATEPEPRRGGERGDGDAADPGRARLRAAEQVGQPRRVGCRPGVVPQDRGTERTAIRAEHDESVLLAGDRDRGHLRAPARAGDRLRERIPPDVGRRLPGAALAGHDVGRLARGHDRAALGVDEQDLGRLGRAVDSGDESWHGRVVWRTPRKRTRRLQ